VTSSPRRRFWSSGRFARRSRRNREPARAGIDLALHVVERYFGRAEALKVAEHLEYEGKSWMV